MLVSKKIMLAILLVLANSVTLNAMQEESIALRKVEKNNLLIKQPEELIVAIFEYLDCKNLGIAMQVSKKFKRLANHVLSHRTGIFSFPISEKSSQEIRRKIVNAKNISENKNLPKQQMAQLNTQLNKYSQPTALPIPIQTERVLELIRAGADKKIGTQLAFSDEGFLQIFGSILMNIEDQHTRDAIQNGRNSIKKSRRKLRKSKKTLEERFKKLSL